MTTTDDIAAFVTGTTYDDLDDEVRTEAKKRVLDALGIAVGAIGAEPVEILRETVAGVERPGDAVSIWGSDERAWPPLATALNTGMVRYLDYMDAFILPDEVPHPSNNVAAAVAVGEDADRSGRDLLTAVALAYEVHWSFAAYAPLLDRGWDHPTHVNFSATAAASHLLDLDRDAIRNALGIVGTSHNALRVTRTGDIPMWKGMTSGNAARNAVYATMLARNGMTGPQDVFEGRMGWMEVVAGEFDLSFTDGCRRVLETMTKKYMAGTVAQTALEGLEELLAREGIAAGDIEHIQVDTYRRAKQIMGGTGTDDDMGDRYDVTSREVADHSIPYTLAALALDGELLFEQYEHDRIRAPDVQDLLDRVTVTAVPELTALNEEGKMPAHVEVTTADGATHRIEKEQFSGHPDDPMSWDELAAKFHALAAGHYPESRRERIVETVRNLEDHDVRDLTALLGPAEGSTEG
ncbi:MAG: MmgE/PrpD family protein [Haloferacaceae archaeon]